MPKPRSGESKDDYISRCIPIVLNEGTAKDNNQAVAICNSMWQEQSKMTHEELLKAIRNRQKKRTEFSYGILTADKYVQTLVDAAGLDACYMYGSKGNTSFSDVMEKASKTLVYSNPDMEVLEKAVEYTKMSLPDGVELPKNCLMVFKHVLTTPRKDRDGDILRTEGMSIDPKMLLLWQHVHTMPIGKMLAVFAHNKKHIILYSCIVDMNETSHDAAVMVDNGMGRFSHGFRALEFDKTKVEEGMEGGFDIKRGEIMEESLVSVPANVDAETEEVLLSLVEGGKLTSPIMKQVGRGLRQHRNLVLPVNLKLLINGQEVKCENESGDRREEEKRVRFSSPEETDEDRDEIETKEAAKDKEVKAKAQQVEPEEDGDDMDDDQKTQVCPKCGSENIKEGVCQKCGYKITEKQEDETEEEEMEEEEKSTEDSSTKNQDVSVKEAMTIVIAKASKEERKQLMNILTSLEESDRRSERVKHYEALMG